jgi:hypothetical protein
MGKYMVASLEGAERYGGDIGDLVEVPDSEVLAVVAAGWVTDNKAAVRPKEEK